MTEEDWVLVLEVFHACRSRRGDKGRDDRKFLFHGPLEPQRRVRNFLRSARLLERAGSSRADVRLDRDGSPIFRCTGHSQRSIDRRQSLRTCVGLSAVGADARSSNFYLRTKAKWKRPFAPHLKESLMHDLFMQEPLAALLQVIVIDLTLAGDNAIVIGLAAVSGKAQDGAISV
jgi:hypothetical protein